MDNRTKISIKELEYVRKYCLAETYPASDERCPYLKAMILGSLLTKDGNFKKSDAMFLCRYPDRSMPIHEASLISELAQCPDPK